MGMKAKLIDPEKADWARLDGFADRTVFQTREWLQFVRETQRAKIVLCELAADGETVGYFAGLVFSRFGVRILGSSFPGWTTPYMGFNLVSGASRKAALAAVERTAWDTLKCLHMEVSDPFFSVDDGKENGFACEAYASYRSDLTETEDKLFGKMDSACRRCVRKAEKSGVTIEEAHDLDFADEYYEQLKDVFAKQGLVPTYSVERVRALGSKSRTHRPYPAGASARPGREVYCHGNLSRLQQDRRILGKCEFPFQPEPAPERGHSLVRHEVLEAPWGRNLRLGRGRDVQREIRLCPTPRAMVYQVALCLDLEAPWTSPGHVREKTTVSRMVTEPSKVAGGRWNRIRGSLVDCLPHFGIQAKSLVTTSVTLLFESLVKMRITPAPEGSSE